MISRRMKRPLIGTVVLTALVALTLLRPVHAQTPTPKPPAGLTIIGGETAKAGEFPAMVALVYREPGELYQECGGTLIAERWVLTAAHCVFNYYSAISPQNFRVTLGSLSALNEDNQGQIVKVSAVIPHTGYDPNSHNNDIALVRLTEPVDFSKTKLVTATLLSLAEEATLAAPGVNAVAVGWGNTVTNTSKAPELLQKVSIPIISNAQCNESDWYNGDILNNMLCAGYSDGGKDTCQGDSGGPLFVPKENGLVQAGITSWGRNCATPNKPGVYARVARYHDWIESYTRGRILPLVLTANSVAIGEPVGFTAIAQQSRAGDFFTVSFGDQSSSERSTPLPEASSLMTDALKTRTFTHTYKHAGTYTLTADLVAEFNQTSRATATVKVRSTGLRVRFDQQKTIVPGKEASFDVFVSDPPLRDGKATGEVQLAFSDGVKTEQNLPLPQPNFWEALSFNYTRTFTYSGSYGITATVLSGIYSDTVDVLPNTVHSDIYSDTVDVLTNTVEFVTDTIKVVPFATLKLEPAKATISLTESLALTATILRGTSPITDVWISYEVSKDSMGSSYGYMDGSTFFPLLPGVALITATVYLQETDEYLTATATVTIPKSGTLNPAILGPASLKLEPVETKILLPESLALTTTILRGTSPITDVHVQVSYEVSNNPMGYPYGGLSSFGETANAWFFPEYPGVALITATAYLQETDEHLTATATITILNSLNYKVTNGILNVENSYTVKGNAISLNAVSPIRCCNRWQNSFNEGTRITLIESLGSPIDSAMTDGGREPGRVPLPYYIEIRATHPDYGEFQTPQYGPYQLTFDLAKVLNPTGTTSVVVSQALQNTIFDLDSLHIEHYSDNLWRRAITEPFNTDADYTYGWKTLPTDTTFSASLSQLGNFSLTSQGAALQTVYLPLVLR